MPRTFWILYVVWMAAMAWFLSGCTDTGSHKGYVIVIGNYCQANSLDKAVTFNQSQDETHVTCTLKFKKEAQ